MSNTIRIKRRPSSGAAGEPSSLFNGELAFNEHDNILYYGYGSGVGTNGVATSRPPIAGSGYFAHRGGINASGLWSIDITGNSSSVTNGVYTVNNQSIGGVKTFNNIVFCESGIFSSGVSSIQSHPSFVAATQFAVFNANPSGSSQAILTRTASEVKSDIGLNNLTNDAQVKKIPSSTVGYIPTWSVNTGDELGTGYSVETVLTGGSGSIPRSDAVKTYIDTVVSSGITVNDAMIFKGVIDCSTNPLYPYGDQGWTYKISVAGKIGGASGPSVEVNDTIICTTDSTPSGTHAEVGSNWIILQTNINDSSILVTGPASATSGNFALFDGTTGKIIKDAGFAATTVGQNLVSLTNPSSISFLRLNANNTVTARSASELKTDLNLNNVENTALSSWAGSTNLAVLGTIVSGVWNGTTIAVNNGGTGQTSYTDGQLLIGNTTGNTLTKSTLTEGTGIDITNGNGSITIAHEDTSTLTGEQGSNGIASITVDGLGHVTAVTTATYLTAGTVCSAIVDCALDGGSF